MFAILCIDILLLDWHNAIIQTDADTLKLELISVKFTKEY